jgi:hypothetical protein
MGKRERKFVSLEEARVQLLEDCTNAVKEPLERYNKITKVAPYWIAACVIISVIGAVIVNL